MANARGQGGAPSSLAPAPLPGSGRFRIGRLGPELQRIRSTQSGREYYTVDHLERLVEFQARTPYGREGRPGKVWCRTLHGAGANCTSCTSCHFCRQKTADRKTLCACASWAKAPSGGRGRGTWCGNCLEMRMGENIEEALANPAWRCPVCREICNCSGVNCQRARRDLAPTQQLHFEASNYGWDSVAHYLILTELKQGRALEMVEREVDERLRQKQLAALNAPAPEALPGAAARLDHAARRRANMRAALARELPRPLTPDSDDGRGFQQGAADGAASDDDVDACFYGPVSEDDDDDDDEGGAADAVDPADWVVDDEDTRALKKKSLYDIEKNGIGPNWNLNHSMKRAEARRLEQEARLKASLRRVRRVDDAASAKSESPRTRQRRMLDALIERKSDADDSGASGGSDGEREPEACAVAYDASDDDLPPPAPALRAMPAPRAALAHAAPTRAPQCDPPVRAPLQPLHEPHLAAASMRALAAARRGRDVVPYEESDFGGGAAVVTNFLLSGAQQPAHPRVQPMLHMARRVERDMPTAVAELELPARPRPPAEPRAAPLEPAAEHAQPPVSMHAAERPHAERPRAAELQHGGERTAGVRIPAGERVHAHAPERLHAVVERTAAGEHAFAVERVTHGGERAHGDARAHAARPRLHSVGGPSVAGRKRVHSQNSGAVRRTSGPQLVAFEGADADEEASDEDFQAPPQARRRVARPSGTFALSPERAAADPDALNAAVPPPAQEDAVLEPHARVVPHAPPRPHAGPAPADTPPRAAPAPPSPAPPAAVFAGDSDECELAAEEHAARAPGALAALLATARELPWSQFDTPARCLQEASRLLCRLSRQPAVVDDDLLGDDDDDDAAETRAAAAATAVAAARAEAAGTGPLPLRTCDDVRAAVALLLLLARHLPVPQTGPQVVRRLARFSGAGALCDFGASCVTARAILLRANFRLLRRMALRDCSVAEVAGGVMDCIAVLASEYEALQAWRADLGARRSAEVIGSLHLPAATDAASSRARRDAVECRLEEDTALIESALAHAARALRVHRAAPGAMALLRGPLLARLLHPGGCFDAALRKAALELLRAAARHAPPLEPQPPPPDDDMDDEEYSAALARMTRYNARADAQRAAERACATELCTGVLPALLTLLECDYPGRATAAPAPGSAAAPPARLVRAALHGSGVEKLLVRCVSDVLAAGLRSGALSWAAVEAAALAPHAPLEFWRRAGPSMRVLAARLLEGVVRGAPGCGTEPAEAGALMRAWVLTVADHEQSRTNAAMQAALGLTDALACCGATQQLFAGVTRAALEERTYTWERRRVDAVHALARNAAATPSAPFWAAALIDTVEHRADDGWTFHTDVMLTFLAQSLAPSLHSPARPGSALCRTLARANNMLAALARMQPQQTRNRMLAYLATHLGAALSSALCAFPADAATTGAAMEFLYCACELPQPGPEGGTRLGLDMAAAVAPGLSAPRRGLCGFTLCCMLPAYLRQGYYSAAHAAAAAAAARLATALLARVAPPEEHDAFEAHLALPLLLAPLLDALSPAAERGGAAPQVPSAVRAAVCRLLAQLVATRPVLMAAALAAADAPLPAAPRQDVAPLRAGAPLPPPVFRAAVGRLLRAALRDALGAVHDAVAATGAAVPAPAAGEPAAWTSLDAASAAETRTAFRWALGLPPPCPVFDAELPGFQRRKAGLAAVHGMAPEAAETQEAAACAGLQLASLLAEHCGAEPACVDAAARLARAAAPAVRTAVARGALPHLHEAHTALVQRTGAADALVDAKPAENPAPPPAAAPPLSQSTGSQQELPHVLLCELPSRRDAAPRNDRSAPFRLVALLVPQAGAAPPAVRPYNGGAHNVLDVSLVDDSGGAPDVAAAARLLCLGRKADAAAALLQPLWAAGKPRVLLIEAEFHKRNLCGRTLALAPPAHPRAMALLEWQQRWAAAAPATDKMMSV